MTYTLGSFCTGYAGLDLAVEAVLGPAEHLWHAEFDREKSKILAAHWPTVPNLGDITAVDWAAVPAPTVVTGGFPCQPASLAGRRLGTDDERWLFDDIADAIGRMDPQPGLLLFENVPGLLTASRGDAMARVVHSLAALGYMGTWRPVRASDVGAPHRRERIFLFAWPTGTDPRRWTPRPGPAPRPQDSATPLLPTPCARDYKGTGPSEAGRNSPSLAALWALLGDDPDRPWGPYATAVDHWEHVTGRPAPAPTEPAPRGLPRLNPWFVEWMMGCPDGWVTGHVGRNHAIHALGDGVVWQQGVHAVRELLAAGAAS